MKHIKTATEDYYMDDQDKLHGEFKSYYNNGQLHVHGFYLGDERHGEYKVYHDNGELQDHCFYVGDELHGENNAYHDNGQLHLHCFFVNGKYHGEFKSYYDSGRLARHCFFVENEDVMNEVKLLVRDLSNITDEEKVILKLQLGLDL